MGKNRLFVPQETLDAWMAEDRVVLAGDELTVVAEARRYSLAPAVRFMNDVAGTGDPHGLLGRVKEKRQLDEAGAEQYMGSVVLGDSAYEVQEGFVGTPIELEEHAAPNIGTAVAAATGEDEPASDEVLLAKFLLEKL